MRSALEGLRIWADEMSALVKLSDGQVIMDFCSVSFMSPNVIEILIKLLSDRIYLLNCSNFARNMLHAAGRSANLLD